MFWPLIWILLILGFLIIIFKKIRPWWKKISFLALVFILSLFPANKTIFPMHPPIQSTGPLEIKNYYTYLSHKTAYQNMATDGEDRQIPIAIWQPKSLDLDGHPLLVFSHGSFGTAESNESLYRELASNGFIVASLSHPYHSFSSRLSDGRIIKMDKDYFNSVTFSKGAENLDDTLDRFENWLGIRREDLNFVLDSLLDPEGEFGSYINRDRVYLSGHSLGASLALDIGRQRPDDLAGIIALEGPFVGDIVGIQGDKYIFTDEEYPLPILHIYSDALYGRLGDIATYQRNQEYIDINSPKFVNVHIGGSGHIGLTDLSRVSPILTELIDRMTGGGSNTKSADQSLKEINQVTLDFLRENT